MTRWCEHCDANHAEPRRRLCSACRQYRTRNGVLPPARLLRRRVERAVERDLARRCA